MVREGRDHPDFRVITILNEVLSKDLLGSLDGHSY